MNLEEELDKIKANREKRRFPVQSHNKHLQNGVDWSLAKIVYQDYIMRYGSDQPLERLAERGGFGCWELIFHLRSMIARQSKIIKELRK